MPTSGLSGHYLYQIMRKFWIYFASIAMLAACKTTNNEVIMDNTFESRYELVDAKDFNDNIFKLVSEDFTVITAGEQANSMLAGWGGIGVLFDKPVTWGVLRANRFTLEKMRETGTFTMCYFAEEYKEDIMKFGMASGRDSKKMEETALSLMQTPAGVPAFEEAKIIIECKLIAATSVNKDEFYTEEARQFFQEGFDDAGDWHKIVFGDITNIYVKK